MDSWTDNGHIDGLTHRKIILLSHTLTMRPNDEASLVEFHSDRQMDGRWMQGPTDAWKNNVALAYPVWKNFIQWFRRRKCDGQMDGWMDRQAFTVSPSLQPS